MSSARNEEWTADQWREDRSNNRNRPAVIPRPLIARVGPHGGKAVPMIACQELDWPDDLFKDIAADDVILRPREDRIPTVRTDSASHGVL